MNKVGITACITSREHQPDFQVYGALRKAAQYALQYGVETRICVSSDPYTVALARNRGVAEFLRDKDATHLFFLDNDVFIPSDTLAVLAAVDAPIAVGCYPSFKNTIGNEENLHHSQPYLTIKINGEWLMHWFDGVAEVEEVVSLCLGT